MPRAGAITFKGNPMTLIGNEVKAGQQAPEFTSHRFEGGLKTVTLADLKGKPTLISVVPSLDTPVCQKQTKTFNTELSSLGDKVRAVFTNNMDESTGIHFHGQELPNAMDGVPFVTQPPILPGERFTYEFTARTPGSHMYHSHHNATDQVGRGLLGAFIVQPKDPADRYDQKFGADQDIVWISNDSLGGFTINGRGFPATAPIVATLGDRIAIRFMNEGSMMHPWHLHGMPMRVVARDGYPLGSASFLCDTLGVNPGERWDVIIDCEDPGAWAFHCHILPHAEGPDGMFGMVTALVIQEPAAAATRSAAPTADPIRTAALAGGSTAFLCRIPTATS